jgi:hypothetical protein
MTTTTTTTRQVTEAQLSACHRIEDYNRHIVFYQVESAHEVGQEYVVMFDRVHKCLTCTCPAGNPPIVNGLPLYAIRNCWHKRAAVEHASQIRLERREQDEAAMVELAEEIIAEAAMWARVAVAAPQVATAYELQQAASLNDRRTFHFLR